MKAPAFAGFRIKSGWAAVVVLAGNVKRPGLCHAGVLEMSDPARPETRQPHHNRRGVQEEDKAAIASRSDLVALATRRAIHDLLALLADKDLHLGGAGIVVGSLGDPARISNPHIRAHALEGRLFWKTLEQELTAQTIESQAFLDKELPVKAPARLRLDPVLLAEQLAGLGQGIRPWRLEQKQAALAAWLLLVG
jgi:hypothetical protein